MKNPDKKDLWYKDGLRFQCQRCGNCCRGEPGYVWVNPEEIQNISSYLGLQIEEFARKHLKRVGQRLSLRELPNGDCVMYDGGCRIYAVRPRQCSTFPFWPSNLASYEAWAGLKRFCKGIDKGPLHTFQTIQEIASVTTT
jgi:Fe-S-cluster containining protein